MAFDSGILEGKKQVEKDEIKFNVDCRVRQVRQSTINQIKVQSIQSKYNQAH